MNSRSYQSIVDGMDESQIGSAMLLPAHPEALSPSDDDEQQLVKKLPPKPNSSRAVKLSQSLQYASDTKNNDNSNKNNSAKLNQTSVPTQSACTIDLLGSHQKLPSSNTGTAAGVNDNGLIDGNDSEMANTAPIAKLITIKTYRPAKVFAGLTVLVSLVLLLIAGISTEWLGRYDRPESPTGTTFYRYGFFEFCRGYLTEKTLASDVTCVFFPVYHKTWVQVCAALYASSMFLAAAGLVLLCVAMKLDTDNSAKWRLYRAAVCLLVAAALMLICCLLIWSARFLFEATILSPRPPKVAASSLKTNEIENMAGQPFSYPNVTMTETDTYNVHANFWPKVMSSITIGWAYVLAWIGALLLVMSAIVLILDGKKDEHICEEQLVYPSLA